MKKISEKVCRAGYVVDSVNYFKIIWFSLMLFMLGLSLPSPDNLQAETVNRKGILFYDDCEDGPSTEDWKIFGADPVQQPNSILEASSDRARAGNKSYKFVLPPYGVDGIDSHDKRTEMRPYRSTNPDIINFEKAVEYWIGFSYFIPTDFVTPTGNFILNGTSYSAWGLWSQFHAAVDDPGCPEFTTNPTCTSYFSTVDPLKFTFFIQAENDICSSHETRDRFTEIKNLDFFKGQWMDVVYNFKFHYDQAYNPFFKVWINGKQIVDDKVIPDDPKSGINCWNDQNFPYWKIGLYAIQNNWLTTYVDEIRIGGPTSDYASVAPGSASTDSTSPVISSFSATKVTIQKANLSWSVNDSGGSHLDRIKLFRALDSNGSPAATWKELTTEEIVFTTAVDEDVRTIDDGVSSTGVYWYKIKVYDKAGNITDSAAVKVDLTAVNPPPAAPGGLIVK